MNPLTDRQIITRFRLKPKDKVIDIGGSMRQHEEIKIDTLVDLIRPEKAPYGASPLKAKKFVQCDVTRQKLPFKDKYFDFCLCTHTLEDLNNPFLLLEEMQRVSKRGYIATPSMGIDMAFSHIDYTDWLSGGRRVPGHGHHKWFFTKQKNKLIITPKNYPILYTTSFHFSGWLGEAETQYYWDKQITFQEIKDFNIHTLLDFYQDFVDKNQSKLIKSPVLIYLDDPFHYLKALIKLLIRRGNGYMYRKIR